MIENKNEFQCLGEGQLKPALLRKSVEPEHLLSQMPMPKASFLGSDVGNPHPLKIDLNKPQEKRLCSQKYKCSLSFSIFHGFEGSDGMFATSPSGSFPSQIVIAAFFPLPAVQIMESFLPFTVSREKPRQVNGSSRRKQKSSLKLEVLELLRRETR